MGTAPTPAEPRPVRPPRDWKDAARLGGFHREVGLTIDPAESGNGVCVVVGTVEPRHLNLNQVVHGGVYSTALDTAMGAAVVSLLSEQEVTATTSLYIDFLRPARLGQKLVGRGEVVRRGRHLAFCRGTLHDGEGLLLGSGSGTWYIWSTGDGTWGSRATPARRSPRVPPSAPR